MKLVLKQLYTAEPPNATRAAARPVRCRSRLAACALLGSLATCPALHAAFDIHAWATRRVIKPSGRALSYVLLDASMYEDSKAQLRDLRLLQDGKEVPFVLKNAYGTIQEEQMTASLMDKAVVPGVGVQFVLEARAGDPHDQISIDTNQIDFRQQVRVETSDDRRHWDMVRRDGTIFKVSSADTRAAGLSVSYPVSTRRYVRVTIEGWRNLAWVRSASISFVHTTLAERNLVADLKPTVVQDEKEHVTRLSFDLGFARPYDRITVVAGAGWFSRLAEVFTSADEKTWSVAGSGTLFRSASKEDLTIEVPERWDRHIRVEIHNNDNAPLMIQGARIEALERRLIFAAKPGPLALYSGNRNAEAARYDLGSVLPAGAEAAEGYLGVSERNPAYQAPKPPANSQSWMLTGLLFLLVPAVGALAFRMLREAKPA